MKQQLQPGERIRVLVVDDSVVIRRLVTSILEQDPMLEVVGTASNGIVGLQRIRQWSPHLITLDIEMPEMDGLEMLRTIRLSQPNLRVIMFSTLTERGAAITLDALSLGADDYVAKPSGHSSLETSRARLCAEMIPKIKQFFSLPQSLQANAAPPPVQSTTFAAVSRVRPQVVVFGISTGGPATLGAILPLLPADFPLPVLIVQHMPAVFTRLLAERLDANCPLKVREAAEGDRVERGSIFIAPGDFHMTVVRDRQSVRIALNQASPENFCRPAADVLFRSAAEVYGAAVLPVVLTGMGQDGLRGVQVLKACGASVLVQDEASSIVWGMPGAVVRSGLADAILPIENIAPQMIRLSGAR